MAVLARATRAELEAIAAQDTLPRHDLLKPAETGSVMIEGRAGGTGGRFNLGEATMTRCIVRIEGGTMGHAYALGRDKRKAMIAAVLDAMLQNEPKDGALHEAVAQLRDQQQAARTSASRKAAATKVEFFTMVRGE
jgi:alpha-D-ribose 1-methylphosphonate 5-triphosphate synthase subunit PhnG